MDDQTINLTDNPADDAANPAVSATPVAQPTDGQPAVSQTPVVEPPAQPVSDDPTTPIPSVTDPVPSATDEVSQPSVDAPVTPEVPETQPREVDLNVQPDAVTTDVKPEVSAMATPVTPPAVEPETDTTIAQQPGAVASDEPATPAVEESSTPVVEPMSTEPVATPEKIEAELPATPEPTTTPMPSDDEVDVAPAPSAFPPVSQSVKPPEGSDVVQPAQPATVAPVTEPTVAAQTVDPMAATPAPAAVAPQDPVPSSVPGDQAADELKKQHDPIFVMPERLEMGQVVNVKVKVGMVAHPMEEGHHIQSVELFSADKSLGKKEFKVGVDMVPEADFQVPLTAGTELKAIIYCNMHGKWEGTQSV